MSDICPVCASPHLSVFLERSGVPVHQNVALPTPDQARAAPRGDLRLGCCPECGFITNTRFDPSLVDYGSGYENEQAHSGLFGAHVDGLIDGLIAQGVSGVDVVEVACGQGTFLNRLCERGGNRGVGFDPAYRGPLESAHARFVRDYFGAGAAVRADVVICRHAIEHVPQPLALLNAVREGLAEANDAIVAFETPDVRWILDNVAVHDFFYEHCSYFTPQSLSHAFHTAGFATQRIDHLFGDQYLWLEASSAAADDSTRVPRGARPLLASVEHYRASERARLETLSKRLRDLRALGKVALWGAGAKGVTFANLLDPDQEFVDCIVDINPKKQGKFIPGTAHAIVSAADLAGRGIQSVMVMNPNYLSEIRSQIQSAGLALRVETEAET